MKSLIITLLLTLVAIQNLYSIEGELLFYIDNDQSDNYSIVARRISVNDPLFGINFMEVNTNLYDQVISDEIEYVNTWPPYDYKLGFDYLRDEGSIGWPLIGEGKLEFTIFLNGETDAHIAFRFFIDLVHYKENDFYDITFFYSAPNNSLIAKTNAIYTEIINGSFVNCWELQGMQRDISSYINDVELTNFLATGPEQDIKTIFTTATMGFPDPENFQTGEEYGPGTFAPLWRGVYYGLTVSQTTFTKNNVVYNFRNWETPNNYSSSTTFRIEDQTSEFKSMFQPTFPLNVSSYLDGGLSGSYNLTWLNPPITQTWQFGNVFNAFKFEQPNSDRYTVAAPSTFQELGTNWHFQKWNDGSTNTTKANLQITAPTYFTAYYKGIQRSDVQTAYVNNNQRKFIKSDDGDLHSVYESMGKVWYERSTDDGQSWEIIGGQPIDSYDSKQPSIDYLPYSTGSVQCIVIAYQRKVSNTISEVCFRIYDDGVFKYWYQLEQFNWDGSYSEVNATPVVSISKDNQILFVWKSALPLPGDPLGVQKLIFSFGKLVRDYYVTSYHYEPWPLQQLKEIPTTSINSKNPTIAIHKGTDMMRYHLAYQESNASIKYWSCTYNLNTGQLTYVNPTTLSSSTGFTEHSNPSIISLGTTARVCWVGFRMVYGEVEQEVDAYPQYRVLFKRTDKPTTWQFGNNVSSPNINKQNDNSYFALAWSENENQIWFADNTLSEVKLFSDFTGQQIQLNNGADKSSMYCMAYEHNSGVPFYFEQSVNLESFYLPLPKITSTFLASGREGIISTDSTEFYFALGDIEVNGQTINFLEIPDTVAINDLNSINQCLITEPITLSDNSSFHYSVQYGLNDSLSAVQAITGDRFINFKVLLIDDATGQSMGEYDNVTYTQNNLYQYNNISYQVNTQGIGNRTARLKLVLDNNFESEYSLSRIFANESVLGKTTVKQISYSGSEVIKTYELSQNYPNPFNPTTTIKFQIPKAGNVTLKIYDILGAEVATLVDEFKEVGKFEVNFNASSLASGVYIYRLNANDYVNVKKMVLLK